MSRIPLKDRESSTPSPKAGTFAFRCRKRSGQQRMAKSQIASVRRGRSTVTETEWIQRVIRLKPRARGFHVVTDEVLGQLPELGQIEIGMLHLFIQHTSASLSINENVR